jgi:UDP-GlcNAc:undecaprenyl-phosphate GlcNAc-1-phosphate transferase
MKYQLLFFPIAALILSLFIIPLLRSIAFKIQLVDKPNFRKVHHNHIPLVGGLGLAITTAFALLPSLMMGINFYPIAAILVGAIVMLVMGVLDDKMDIRASLKLLIQLILAHYIYANGIRIDSFYGIMGINEIPEFAAYFLTIIIITGVVNAFNLMDGIDGLASGLAIVSLIVFSQIAFFLDNSALGLLLITLTGSLIGFLRFNFSKKSKIFMGDAGSLLLGFVLVVSAISLLQSAGNTSYIRLAAPAVFGILLVPVIDSLRVYRRRMKEGKSPFSPDKTHIHHLVLGFGVKHKTASIIIVTMVVMIMIVSFLASYTLGITLAIGFSLLFYYIVARVLQINKGIADWKAKIIEIEKRHQH